MRRAKRDASELPTMAWRATCRNYEVARKGVLGAYRPIRWCASVCVGSLPRRRDEREVALFAVASSGLRPSRASSCRLRPMTSGSGFAGCFSVLP
jgi:hypothetical protein